MAAPSKAYIRHIPMNYKTNPSEFAQRIKRIQDEMKCEGIDALVASSNVALLYLFGEIYSGLCYIPQEGEAKYIIRKPQSYGSASDIAYVRKIEQLAELCDLSQVKTLALELDELSYNEVQRQQNIFGSVELRNASTLLRRIRSIKTPLEIEMIRQGIAKHISVYQQVQGLYREGMTDIELQIEIERVMRLEGSVGVFRCFGSAMEIHMGSLLVGDNAATASPYDFAMGGAGSASLPLGANGTVLSEGTSIMLDMAGNYGTYLSDITRTFSIGRLPEEAYRLHELSRRMHREVMQIAKVGTPCAEIYQRCAEIAEQAGAKEYFMGLGQQAAFVGHGLGLQINELPVLTPRSKEVLEAGMVIAFEPKFVLPKIGAVGVENTYLITEDGVENLSPLSEEIIDLKTPTL